MTTNQEGQHAAIRASTGTSRSYNEDWHAVFDGDGVAAGNFDSRMLAWINLNLGTSYTNVNAARAAYAISQGFVSWSSMSTASVYTSEAVSLFARMTTPPSVARKQAINECIKSLKTAGVWSKLEVLHVYAAADSQAALLNWCSTSYNATLVNAPTFTADYGYATNGTSNYINTNFAPGSSVLSGQNDASMGLWLPKARQTPTCWDITSPNHSLIWRNTDTSFYGGLNHTIAAADTVTGLLETHHLVGVSRTGASTTKLYQSNTTSSVLTRASTGRPTGSMWIGARNWNMTPNTFGACDYSAFWYGKGLSDADVTAMQSAFVAYMRATSNYLYGLDCWGDSRTLGSTQTPFPDQVRTNKSNKRIARNGGVVSGDTSTQILSRMTASTAYYDFVQVIWAGYNDRNSVSTVQANIQSMVALANSRNGGKYLVLTIPPPRDPAFYAGVTDGDNIRTINTWIKATYGAKAVDVTAALTSGDPNGVTLAAYVINTVTDYIHFNTAGLALVAADVETACLANGW